MPLTPKDDVSESRGEQQPTERDGEALAELRERIDELDERTAVPLGLDTLGELHDAHHGHTEAVDQSVGELEKRVDEIEERVDRQAHVIHSLVKMTEWLSAGMGGRKLNQGRKIVENEGSDGFPYEWDSPVLEFKGRYRE